MSDTDEAVEHVPYSENNPNHVPNPLYQSGSVDTTGTLGDLSNRIERVSPLFAQHKEAVFKAAGLDPYGQPLSDEAAAVEDEPVAVVAPEHTLTSGAADTTGLSGGDGTILIPSPGVPQPDPAVSDTAETSDDSDDADSSDEELNLPEGVELPPEDASSRDWEVFADSQGLDADKMLRKVDYIAAVKAALVAKLASEDSVSDADDSSEETPEAVVPQVPSTEE